MKEESPLFFGEECELSSECSVDTLYWSLLGDDYCHNYYPFNTKACCWDGGDCDPKILFFGDCKVLVISSSESCPATTLKKLGDGYCNDYIPIIQRHAAGMGETV